MDLLGHLLLQEHGRVQVRDPCIKKFITVEYSPFFLDLELEICEGFEESYHRRELVWKRRRRWRWITPSAPTFLTR